MTIAVPGEAAGLLDAPSAFRRLVGAAIDPAYRRAAALLGDRSEAEDAVHDAAERAWRQGGSLRNQEQFEAWFAKILLNVCRDRLRRRRRITAIEMAASDGAFDTVIDRGAEAHVERAAHRSTLVAGLAALSADERIAIVLRYDADLTVPEIARLTGAREGTVKSRLHSALRRLRAIVPEGDR